MRVVYECSKPVTFNDISNSLLRKTKAGLQYLFTRKGPLTIGAGQVGVFACTKPEVASPDVQFHFIPFSAAGPSEGLHQFSGFTVSVCQLRPESRGRIEIKSADAKQHPAIWPNYLATETDLQTIVDGVKLARTIASAPSLEPYIKREVTPGPNVGSDDELRDHIRHFGYTIYHPAGTCKMGHDTMAVVDEELRVHGVSGLRVADASIMPTVLSGNTNAGCIMIGEKLADILLSDHTWSRIQK